MIDLTAKPFFLDEEGVRWVEKTLASLTDDEKIGQLFVPIGYSGDPEYLEGCMLRHGIGGIMYRTGEAAEMQATHRYLQEHSKVPLLIGANLEAGGDGIAVEGTPFGKQMAVAATGKAANARRLGLVSCSEGAAVGCNWAFAPVCDIDRNWRNPITNVRTYGSDPELVRGFAVEYVRGASEAGVAVAAKHFPGDGCDEVDQHILTSVNTLSCEEWDATYGMVYQALIDEGVQSVMVGHIAQPAYEEALGGNTGELVPASLSSALLQGLLRDKLGFNGLVVTDSTCMVGFSCAMERRLAVPRAIEAGCDMFLFNKNLEEDIAYMRSGLEQGLLSRGRLDEAVERILALKASLGLHRVAAKDIVPGPDALLGLGCDEHMGWAREVAADSVTLVKDTQAALPLSAERTPRVLLEVLGSFPSNERVENRFAELLAKEGFEVERYRHEDFATADFRVETFRSKYDLVLYVGNVENASNKVTNRLDWFTFWGNGNNVPWFVHERPTVFVSLGNPYHLVDVPMVKTYVNAYSNSDIAIEAVVERLMGRAHFAGISPVDAFCGKEWLKW